MTRPRRTQSGRTSRYVASNPFQAATALGARLHVKVLRSVPRAVEWKHPAAPLVYRLDAGGTWVLERDGVVERTGTMKPEAAELHLDACRRTDPRRLAAAVMLAAGEHTTRGPEVRR